nr:hypothetical protein [Nanoarchaeum sp.]
MDILLLVLIIIISLVLFEILKHTLFKSFSKTILVLLLIFTIFFIIISTLSVNNDIKSDNQIIQTGALIVESASESEFGEFIKEKFNDLQDYLTSKFR